MFWKAWEKCYDVGLLIVRLGFGLGFIYFNGWGKLVAGPERWEKTGSVMGHIGIDIGHTFFGFIAMFSETLAALFIALGLFLSAHAGPARLHHDYGLDLPYRHR